MRERERKGVRERERKGVREKGSEKGSEKERKRLYRRAKTKPFLNIFADESNFCWKFCLL